MNIKRTLSLILIFAMIMTSIATAVYAAEGEQTSGAEYAREVEVLSALGIMEGKSETDFAPNDYLTRAEMSTIAIRFLGLDTKNGASEDVLFSDVDTTHWGKYYIDTAAAFDIVHGNGDGTFSPEEETTAEQAIKMLVCALGYEPKAEAEGGYPNGYITTASQLGILKGVKFPDGYDKPIERWKIAVLAYNALDVPLMEIKSYGDKQESAVSKDTTALEKYHKVAEKNGTVLSVFGASLDGSKTADDEVKIGEERYTTKLNISRYIGYNADYYCTIPEGSERSEVIALFPMESRTDRTEISIDDIASVSVSESSATVEYYEADGRKAKTISLSKPVIMYNGKAEKFETSADAQEFLKTHMNQGQIIVLKNSKDDGPDVLFVENYDAYVISNINPELDWISYDIYTAEGIQTGRLDLSTTNEPNRRVFYYDADGRELIMGNLTLGDVIMVYESTDKLIYNIYRSKQKASGKIERIEKLSGTAGIDATEKTYETISDIDFSNITNSKYSAYWSLESDGLTEDGLAYEADVQAYSSEISESTGYQDVDNLGDADFGGLKGKALPEISSGNILRVTRGKWNAGPPTVGSAIRFRNIFDKSKVKPGDILKVTAWVYTDEIWTGSTPTDADPEDQPDAVTNAKMYVSVEANSGAMSGGYNHSTFNKNEGVYRTDVKNNEWVPVSFEYEITKGNAGAADIRFDTSTADTSTCRLRKTQGF